MFIMETLGENSGMIGEEYNGMFEWKIKIRPIVSLTGCDVKECEEEDDDQHLKVKGGVKCFIESMENKKSIQGFSC